jgi:hypothetical protein
MRFSLAFVPLIAAVASTYPADINAPAAPSISESADGYVAISSKMQLRNAVRGEAEISGITHSILSKRNVIYPNMEFRDGPECRATGITWQDDKVLADYHRGQSNRRCPESPEGYYQTGFYPNDTDGRIIATSRIVGHKVIVSRAIKQV